MDLSNSLKLQEIFRQELMRLMFAGGLDSDGLAFSCDQLPGGSERLTVVRRFALETGEHLRGLGVCLASNEKPGVSEVLALHLLSEGARAFGDLATVAACNADLFSGRTPREMVSQLPERCALAVATLRTILDEMPPGRTDFTDRDVRSAAWKTSLASDQMRTQPDGNASA